MGGGRETEGRALRAEPQGAAALRGEGEKAEAAGSQRGEFSDE